MGISRYLSDHSYVLIIIMCIYMSGTTL